MQMFLDLTEPLVKWLQHLDSTIGLNLDDTKSILLYNMALDGDDPFIEFMTQQVPFDSGHANLYELISTVLEEDIVADTTEYLNNPVDSYLALMGYSIERIYRVKVLKGENSDIRIYCLAEVNNVSDNN